MDKVARGFVNFSRDESGAAAAEYALIIGAVSLLIVAGAIVLGGGIGNFFTALGQWFAGLALPPQPTIP